MFYKDIIIYSSLKKIFHKTLSIYIIIIFCIFIRGYLGNLTGILTPLFLG